MRDLETITMALEAAEKGMLVFGTLHTNNAAKTIDRIVNVFPSAEQEGIRQVLGETIRGIVAQQLLPKVGGGRVAALEILFGSPQIGNMIREAKVSQITSAIQTGKKEGMMSMDQSIAVLLEAGLVTTEAAMDKAIDKTWMAARAAAPAESAPGPSGATPSSPRASAPPPRPATSTPAAPLPPVPSRPAPGAPPPAMSPAAPPPRPNLPPPAARPPVTAGAPPPPVAGRKPPG